MPARKKNGPNNPRPACDERDLSSALLENASVGIVVANSNGDIVIVNSLAEQMFGFKRDELIGQPLEILLPKRFRHVHALHRDSYFSGPKVRTMGLGIELTGQRKDGREFPIEGSLSYVEANGEVLAVSFIADITERKRVEETRRVFQEKLQLAIQATGIGLFEWEPDTGAAWYSSEWKDLLGYGADEIEDRYEEWEKRLHPEDKERVVANLQDYCRNPEGNHYAEFRMLHRDGSYHWYYGGGAFDVHSSLPRGRVLGTMQDITERRQSSEQLHLLTGRLISAREEEAKTLARELHDSLGQRMAVLNMGVCELEGLVSSQPELAVRKIRLLGDEISHVAKIVHDLSRQLHPSVLSQLGLTTALKVECAGYSKPHGVRVAFSAKNIPQLLPDDIALCLYRIAQESLQNIRRHSRAREASVLLNCSDSEIVMVVRDSGEGFEVDAVRRNGSLGLVSMEERVRLVRGRLSVRSKPGEGTQIEVRVPFAES